MKTESGIKNLKTFIAILLCNSFLANTILIPLKTNQTRCMLIHTSSNEDNIKLNINFP